MTKPPHRREAAREPPGAIGDPPSHASTLVTDDPQVSESVYEKGCREGRSRNFLVGHALACLLRGPREDEEARKSVPYGGQRASRTPSEGVLEEFLYPSAGRPHQGAIAQR